MKFNRLIAWLLSLAMCFTLVACGTTVESDPTVTTQPTEATVESTPAATEPAESTEPAQVSTATPLLYKVTDEKGNVVWLFGSIHVGKEEYYPLPDYVLNAFQGADSLAVEADIVAFEQDMGAQMKALMPLVYTDGTTIKDHIPQELYEKSVAVLEAYNTYTSAIDMYCPAFWSSLIDSLLMLEMGGDVELGIDRYLINTAVTEGKEILEIESAQFQYQMLADFDDDIQIMLLESSVDLYENQEEAAQELASLMDLWAAGDEAAFDQFLNTSEETLTAEEEEMVARYNKTMITDRNLTMADYAENALASGKEVFICVGAAHIVGAGAMAELLAQRGYTVECIIS